jgi:hypothetical protein
VNVRGGRTCQNSCQKFVRSLEDFEGPGKDIHTYMVKQERVCSVECISRSRWCQHVVWLYVCINGGCVVD